MKLYRLCLFMVASVLYLHLGETSEITAEHEVSAQPQEVSRGMMTEFKRDLSGLLTRDSSHLPLVKNMQDAQKTQTRGLLGGILGGGGQGGAGVGGGVGSGLGGGLGGGLLGGGGGGGGLLGGLLGPVTGLLSPILGLLGRSRNQMSFENTGADLNSGSFRIKRQIDAVGSLIEDNYIDDSENVMTNMEGLKNKNMNTDEKIKSETTNNENIRNQEVVDIEETVDADRSKKESVVRRKIDKESTELNEIQRKNELMKVENYSDTVKTYVKRNNDLKEDNKYLDAEDIAESNWKNTGKLKTNYKDNYETIISEKKENKKMDLSNKDYIEASRRFRDSYIIKNTNTKEKTYSKVVSGETEQENREKFYDRISTREKTEENVKMDNKQKKESENINSDSVIFKGENSIDFNDKTSEKDDIMEMDIRYTGETTETSVTSGRSIDDEEDIQEEGINSEQDNLIYSIEIDSQINYVKNVQELDQRRFKEVDKENSKHEDIINLEDTDVLAFEGKNNKNTFDSKLVSTNLIRADNINGNDDNENRGIVETDSSGSGNEGTDDKENTKSTEISDENEGHKRMDRTQIGELSNNNQPSSEASPGYIDYKIPEYKSTESTEAKSRENSPERRYRYRSLPYTLQYNEAGIYRTNIERTYMPFMLRYYPQPSLQRRTLYDFPFKRSLSRKARQLEMPLFNRYPSSVAGSSLLGSYANAHSGNPLLGEGGLGEEEQVGEEEQLGGFGGK